MRGHHEQREKEAQVAQGFSRTHARGRQCVGVSSTGFGFQGLSGEV